MNFEPQTYEELIRMKRCVELTKYYEVTEEELWEIYHFLEQEPEAFIKGGRQNLSLLIGQNTATTQKGSASFEFILYHNNSFRHEMARGVVFSRKAC